MVSFITRPVLTVDIVDFSLMSNRDQMTAIEVIIELLKEAIPKELNHPSKRIWSPGGDGGSLTFLDDNLAAIETAIALAKNLNQFNKGALEFHDARGDKLQLEDDMPARGTGNSLQVRIGLHSGPVSRETDFDDRVNVWGNGMNVSARVASLGKPGQIVASEDYYKQADLASYYGDDQVTCIGRWWAKHHQSLILYNICRDGAGIPGTELQDWFEPFQYPLNLAIGTYEAMLEEHIDRKESAFRTAVLAKRLLDLDRGHERANQVLSDISSARQTRSVGRRVLHDPFFSTLSPDALLHFFTQARFRSFDRGEALCNEGDEAGSLMIVVSGEIEIYLGGGKRLDVTFSEGEIIGEMGLFNPNGRIRTATLKALKETVILDLDYDYLNGEKGPEELASNEIRRLLWLQSRERTEQNKIYNHPLFRDLSNTQRDELAKHCHFLPAEYHDPVDLAIEDLQKYWLLVVEGSIYVEQQDGRKARFDRESCLGPRLLFGANIPYSKVDLSQDTYIVKLPRGVVEDLAKQSETFLNSCLREGWRNIQKFTE